MKKSKFEILNLTSKIKYKKGNQISSKGLNHFKESLISNDYLKEINLSC
jgi:hypothetical protein